MVTNCSNVPCGPGAFRRARLPPLPDGGACGIFRAAAADAAAVYLARLFAIELIAPQFCAPGVVDCAIEETGPGSIVEARCEPITGYAGEGSRRSVDDGLVPADIRLYMLLISASPNSEHFTSFAPSIRRAKS